MSHPSYRELVRSIRVLMDSQRARQDSGELHEPADLDDKRTGYLDEAMQILQSLLELHPQAAVIADAKGEWVLANGAFGRLFGVPTVPQSLPATWATHFSGLLCSHDAALRRVLPGERPAVDLRFGMRKQDGSQACFIAHGTLLYSKENNGLMAWTFFEAGMQQWPSSSSTAPGEGPVTARESPSTGASSSESAATDCRNRDQRDCPVCVEKSRQALRLLMHHTNEQREEMERRIAENYVLTVLPLIEHLKSMSLPASQAYLVETLEFNLRHINSVFRIKVPAATKPLSKREMEICQMIRAGKDSRQIAQALGLKLQTVMVHRKHIRRKLGLKKGSVRLSMFLQTNLTPPFG